MCVVVELRMSAGRLQWCCEGQIKASAQHCLKPKSGCREPRGLECAHQIQQFDSGVGRVPDGHCSLLPTPILSIHGILSLRQAVEVSRGA